MGIIKLLVIIVGIFAPHSGLSESFKMIIVIHHNIDDHIQVFYTSSESRFDFNEKNSIIKNLKRSEEFTKLEFEIPFVPQSIRIDFGNNYESIPHIKEIKFFYRNNSATMYPIDINKYFWFNTFFSEFKINQDLIIAKTKIKGKKLDPNITMWNFKNTSFYYELMNKELDHNYIELELLSTRTSLLDIYNFDPKQISNAKGVTIRLDSSSEFNEYLVELYTPTKYLKNIRLDFSLASENLIKIKKFKIISGSESKIWNPVELLNHFHFNEGFVEKEVRDSILYLSTTKEQYFKAIMVNKNEFQYFSEKILFIIILPITIGILYYCNLFLFKYK